MTYISSQYNSSIYFMIISCFTLVTSIICLYLIIVSKYNPIPTHKYKDPFTKDYCKDGCSIGLCTSKCRMKKNCCSSDTECLDCKDRLSGIHYSSPIKKEKVAGMNWRDANKAIDLENEKIKTLNEDIEANNIFADNRLVDLS